MSELSSHGVLVAYQATPGGAFTTIAELGDIGLPSMSRNEHDASVHNKDIDKYVFGILRRGAMSMPLNFDPTDGTHDHLTGLYKLLFDKTTTGFRVRFTQAGDLDWIFSGQVQSLDPGDAQVDGKLNLDATIRFSGAMKIGAVTIGA